MLKYLKMKILITVFLLYIFVSIAYSQQIIEHYPLLNEKNISYDDTTTNDITYILNDSKINYIEVYFESGSTQANVTFLIDGEPSENCLLDTTNDYINVTILWYDNPDDIPQRDDKTKKCDTNIIKLSKQNNKSIEIRVKTLLNNNEIEYYYKQLFYNNFEYHVSPSSSYPLDTNAENLTYPFNFSYVFPYNNIIKIAYVKYPYCIDNNDDNPSSHKLLCDEDTPCEKNKNFPFYVDLSQLIYDDDVKDTFSPIFDIRILTRTPYEWINTTYYYYLDDKPPQIIEFSSFPENNSNIINHTYIELNLTFEDVKNNSKACSYWINGKYKGYLSYEECKHILLNDLPQKDIKINLTLYDYANNTKSYLFVFNKANNVMDCYFSLDRDSLTCYHKGLPLMQPYLDFEKRENISSSENLTIVLRIPEIPSNVNTILLNGFSDEISYIKGCAFFKYWKNNKTLICKNHKGNITIYYSPNKTANPFEIKIDGIEQDTSKESEILGATYIIANISIINKDDAFVTHLPFKDVKYNLTEFLNEKLPYYVPYDGEHGKIDINYKAFVTVKLKGYYRVISSYTNDYYLKNEEIYLTKPLNVYLKQKVINKDNIYFVDLKTRFPMRYSDIFNETSCDLKEPLYINIFPLENKEIEARYECDIIKLSTQFVKTKISNKRIKYSYIVSYYIPYTRLLNGKTLKYILNTNDLKHFDEREALVVYQNDLSNSLNYTLDEDMLIIQLPYNSGSHKIYVEYWYKLPKKANVSTSDKSNTEDTHKISENNAQSNKHNKHVRSSNSNNKNQNTNSLNKTPSNETTESDTESEIEFVENAITQNEEKSINAFASITGRIIDITRDKSFKVIGVIFFIGISSFIGYSYIMKRKKERMRKSRKEYIKHLKEVF